MSADSKHIKLSNGVLIPRVGLGTWQAKPEEVHDAVTQALDSGYRLIDTATIYQNEGDIGDTLEKYFKTGKLKREDVFLVTKLWVNKNRKEDVESALRESLKLLKTDYVDLYLMHMPATYDHDNKKLDKDVRVDDTWKGMEDIYNKKLARAIGVSNFNNEQIGRILKSAKVPIHNSQVELHLCWLQKDHVDFCHKHNVSVTAYAPIGSPGRAEFKSPTGQDAEWPEGKEPLKMPHVLDLAKKYNKSAAQILLRHLLQKDILIIPKSKNPKRVVENIELYDFELTKEEMESLDNTQQNPGRFFMQDFLKGHPEDPWPTERK